MVRIRSAAPRDFQQLVTLMCDLIRAEGWHVTDRGVLDVVARAAGWISDPSFMILVAADGDELIGYLAVSPELIDDHGGQIGATSVGFYVKPEWRPRGIAGLLWRAAKGVVDEVVCQAFQAIVRPDNRDLGGALERRGFEAIGVLYERRFPDGRQ
jgi:GNAT superfamily N-acetyltransferase